MNEMENSNNSDFQKIFHRTRKSAQVVTMKSGEKSISDCSYISPPGHVSTLKNVSVTEDAISLQLVTMAGVRMEDGRTWSIYFNLSFIDLQPFKPFMLYYIMLLTDGLVVFTYKYNLFIISWNIFTFPKF